MKVKVNKIVTIEDYSEALNNIKEETTELEKELDNLYILAAVVIGMVIIAAIAMVI